MGASGLNGGEKLSAPSERLRRRKGGEEDEGKGGAEKSPQGRGRPRGPEGCPIKEKKVQKVVSSHSKKGCKGGRQPEKVIESVAKKKTPHKKKKNRPPPAGAADVKKKGSSPGGKKRGLEK